MGNSPSEPLSKIALRRIQARKMGDSEYQERRERLLKAAIQVFREKGYKGASLGAIAEAVGIDRASLYYYTAGKEELFREAVLDATTSNVLMAEAAWRGIGSARDKIENFIIALMQSYERHYPYLYLYVQEDMAKITDEKGEWANEMRQLARRMDTAVVRMIRQGIDDGSFRKDLGSAKLIAFGIIGMCNWSHRWYKPSDKLSSVEIGRSFASLILDGLRR